MDHERKERKEGLENNAAGTQGLVEQEHRERHRPRRRTSQRGALAKEREKSQLSASGTAVSRLMSSRIRSCHHGFSSCLLSSSTSKHPTPPPPTSPPTRKHLLYSHGTRSLGIEPASPALFTASTGARFWAVIWTLVVDVLAVDVLGAGDPGSALVAAGVALLEAVELVFGAEGVEEAHCCVYLCMVEVPVGVGLAIALASRTVYLDGWLRSLYDALGLLIAVTARHERSPSIAPLYAIPSSSPNILPSLVLCNALQTQCPLSSNDRDYAT